MMVVAPPESRAESAPVPGTVAVWASLLIGPAAWLLHLNLSYVAVPWVCRTGALGVLHLVTVGTLIVAGTGIALAWWVTRRSSSAPQDAASGARRRSWFMGIAGLLASLYFASVIVAQGVANLFVDPCL